MLSFFYGHAAVLNQDKIALKKEVEIVQKKYGLWFKVKGFSDYKQLFYALHLAKAQNCPYEVAFIRDEDQVVSLILKKSDPEVKTYKYSDTQNLADILPVVR